MRLISFSVTISLALLSPVALAQQSPETTTMGHIRPPARRQPRTPQVHCLRWTPVQAET
jgi:hypothetical protein